MRPRRRSAAVLAVNVAVVALVAACTGGGGGRPRVPSALPPLTITIPTTLVDHSSDSLGTVVGRTTLTIPPLTPGNATLGGTVIADDGSPVAGADIHLERVVDDQVGAADVSAAADGTWNVAGLLGGLYRVRAWRTPDMAQTNPDIFFMGGSETHTLNLRLARFGGEQVQSSLAPNPGVVGEPANLVVEVTAPSVGSDGVVKDEGRSGLPVELVGDGRWAVESPPTQTTSSSGLAGWALSCQAVGAQPLSVVVNGTDTFPLDLPPCVPVPPTTTTTTTLPTSSTTATSLPGATTSTTTRAKHRPGGPPSTGPFGT